MALKEQDVILTTTDADGNTVMQFPITRAENVEGAAYCPVGTVIANAANSDINGYLLCNGAAVSRTTYAELFAIIGTIYGAGDGSTTFNLPNQTDRVRQGGATAGAYKEAGLPDHLHIVSRTADISNESSGTTVANSYDTVMDYNTSNTSRNFKTSAASVNNGIYGKSNTVQMAALVTRPFIKY